MNQLDTKEDEQYSIDTEDKDISLSESEYFEGPLPHPDILQRYESIHHGTANRIIIMAEEQAKHRQNLERQVVTANIKYEGYSVWITFAITMGFMIGGFILIATDKQVAGFITLATTLGLHAINYINQRKQNKKEFEKKKGDSVSEEL